MNLDNEILVSEILTNYFNEFFNKRLGECSVNVKMENIISAHSYLPEHYIYCSIGMNSQIYEITPPPIKSNQLFLEASTQKDLNKYDDLNSIINIFERYLIKDLDKITLSIKLDLLTIGNINDK